MPCAALERESLDPGYLAPSVASRAAETALPAARRWLLGRLGDRNVLGFGIGVRSAGGRPTGEPALQIFVAEKRPLRGLLPGERVERTIGGLPTDVVESGPAATAGVIPLVERRPPYRRPVRPARGGFSVGHHAAEAGTLGARVYEIGRPGGPFFLLSNNHVVAACNRGRVGDAVLQPGATDGGFPQLDTIARLTRFEPLAMTPEVPAEAQVEGALNVVDAAICEELHPGLVSDEIHLFGRVRGWRRAEQVHVGMEVQKTGRTTGHTRAVVESVHVTFRVDFLGGRTAWFTDQIRTTWLGAGGDSGSLVLDRDGAAVGLLFAAGRGYALANYIEHVQDRLRIRLCSEAPPG